MRISLDVWARASRCPACQGPRSWHRPGLMLWFRRGSLSLWGCIWESAREHTLRRVTGLSLLFAIAAAPVAIAEEAAEGDVEAIGGVVRYVELTPTFIANFGVSDSGHLRYVKADVTVRVSNKEAEYAARYHLPALRNSLVLLLSRQDESTVSSSRGRETIKAQALVELREILQAEEGEPFIDDVLFTNFIVQR